MYPEKMVVASLPRVNHNHAGLPEGDKRWAPNMPFKDPVYLWLKGVLVCADVVC